MVDITIYSKTGVEKAVVKDLEYNGTFMGERYVSVSIDSPVVINWAIGDYLDYRGERWTLWLLPATNKVSSVGSFGGAIEYKDIRFCSTEEELRRCSFLDVVLSDNEIHYTSLPNFSFYCATAQDLADRIQANLDRLYPGAWTVEANSAATILSKSLTFSSNNCWEALTMANSELDLNFVVDSAEREITIGGEGSYIETQMVYGKGNGLKSVERTVDENQQVVNRLYAYGNTRNLPYRYYNKRYAEGTSVFDSVQSMYLPNLMLPGICKSMSLADAASSLDENGVMLAGTYGDAGQALTFDSTSHKYLNPDTTEYAGMLYRFYKHFSLSVDETAYYCDRVWIESEDSVTDNGLQEGVKFFDGSDDLVDDIYPSLTGFDSTADLIAAIGPADAAAQNLSYNGTAYEQGALDEIMGAIIDVGDGIIPETEETTPTFYIRIKNIGFDLSDAELDASGDTPRLSMEDGMCAGREFNILECKKQVYSSSAWADYNSSSPVVGPWSYLLKCEVAADDSIGQYFPNDNFTLSQGDKFVILGIKMPDIYVDVAEERMLKAAIVWLGENDKTSFSYTPAINNIYMQDNPETSSLLKEGNVLIIYDADLDINVEMTISQLRIKNDKQIPEYEVTLSNDKEADLVQRVTAQVKQSYSQFIGSGKAVGTPGIYLIGMASGASPTDNNAFSARRSLSMFLRKDVADTAAGKITFSSGTDNKSNADFTDNRGFLGGWMGYGARIDSEGKAEFERVDVRGALHAAELVFNLVDAEEGEAIRSIGHGEIETVTINPSSPSRGTATLKLDGDQWATISGNDICRGTYNTVGKDYDNDDIDEDEEDDNGFRQKKGFFSSYFRITNVTSSKGSCSFNYVLQEGTTEHPCPLMKFAVYGNTSSTKKERQSSMYISAVGVAPRLLFLAGVNDFKIKPENIKIALGNIEGVGVWQEVNYAEYQQTQSDSRKTWTDSEEEDHYAVIKPLHGDAGFYCEDNIYLGGIIDQFKSAAMEIISSEISNIGQAWVSADADSIIIDCDNQGRVLEDKSFEINFDLFYGSHRCTITSFTAIYNNSEMNYTTNVDGSKCITFDVDQNDSLSSGTIQVVITGTYDGTTYTASKTVVIFASRQGAQGGAGASAAWVDVSPSAISIECYNDGKLTSAREEPIIAALYAGGSRVTQNVTATASFDPIDGNYSPSFQQNATISNGYASWSFNFNDLNTPLTASNINITITDGTYTVQKTIPVLPLRQGGVGIGKAGYTAQLTKASDNIVVDSIGNVVGGLSNRLFTAVNIYEPSNNRSLNFQNTGGTPSDGRYKLSIASTGCSATIVTSGNDAGKIKITGISTSNLLNNDGCSVDITATTYDNVVFKFIYPVTFTHLDQSYLTFDLTNEYDSMAYRTQTSQYDGLPVETKIKAYANDGQGNEDILDMPVSRGYMKSVTVSSDLLSAPVTKTTTASDAAYYSEGATLIKIDNNPTGLALYVKSDGTVRVLRTDGVHDDTDLTDTKHWFDISCVVVYGGVEYESPVKRFTLAETTDSTIYRLILSATAISKDESTYTPSSIDVKVSVTDDSGTTVYLPNAIPGDVYVRYIDGTYPPSSVNDLLTTCPQFANLSNKLFTVVLVDLTDANNPEYLDIQTVTINEGGKDGAGQSWINANYDQFVVDCDSDGIISATRYLDLTASLRWGDSDCVISSCDIDTSDLSNVTVGTTYGIGTTEVSKRISFIKNREFSSGIITITLAGALSGSSDIHTAQKTIAVIANQPGADGRGIVSVITYYMLSALYEGVSAPSTDTDPLQNGWFTSYLEPTEELPFLWRFTRTTYTSGTTVEQTDAELIGRYNSKPMPNILGDTLFLDADNMDAWATYYYRSSNSSKWSSSSSSGSVAYKSRITTDNSCDNFSFGIDDVNTCAGYNSYKATVTATSSMSENAYAIVLYQLMYKNGTVEKIETGKWYTLSFWHKGDAINTYNYCLNTASGTKMYVDGVEKAYSYTVQWPASNEWVRHTLTFPTKASFGQTSSYQIEWRMPLEANVEKSASISMPKLESGKMATAYVSAFSVTDPIARTSTWEEGKVFYKGSAGEPYLDIAGLSAKWYRCKRTHVSSQSNKPVEGTETAYWEPASDFNFIATDLLLADQAVIDLMYSQKILMRDSNNVLTASINADGKGSYVVYYSNGRKRMEISHEGLWKYYYDNDANSEAWTLGMGGDITKFVEGQFYNLPLKKLSPSDNKTFDGTETYTLLENFWQYKSGSQGLAQFNDKIYTATQQPSNPATATVIADGWYTPDSATYQVLTEDGTKYALRVYHIVEGFIVSDVELTTLNLQ